MNKVAINQINRIAWNLALAKLLGSEYWVAREAFNFEACFARGETPQQAYEAFDAWAMGGDR